MEWIQNTEKQNNEITKQRMLQKGEKTGKNSEKQRKIIYFIYNIKKIYKKK